MMMDHEIQKLPGLGTRSVFTFANSTVAAIISNRIIHILTPFLPHWGYSGPIY